MVGVSLLSLTLKLPIDCLLVCVLIAFVVVITAAAAAAVVGRVIDDGFFAIYVVIV